MDTAMNRRRFDAAFVVQVIGIAAFAYFFFVVLAEMLRDDAGAFPYLLLWIPNVLFVGVGTMLLLRLDYR